MAWYWPAGHGEHTTVPDETAYSPAVQTTQAEFPTLAADWPPGHAVQLAEAATP